MSNNIRISTSPLTNAIYVGRVTKTGLWAPGKQDVTVDAILAVAEHVTAFGAPVILTGCGEKITITVERAPL